MMWAAILLIGTLAGTLGGVVGFGSSVILLPVLAFVFGAKEAVPIMAVAALVGNLARVLVWWREVDWRATAAFAVTAVPSAALGARTLTQMNGRWIELALGGFLIAVVPLRRLMAARGWSVSLAGLAVAGAILGFLTGIVASTGPINAPVFLAHGLVKGAYIATEAASSAAVYITKTGVFRALGAMPIETILRGLIVGAALMAGARLAKSLVLRLEPDQYRHVMDVLLVISGAAMLWGAG